MIKNIIIIVFLLILVGVGTGNISQEQVKKLGENFIHYGKEAINNNSKLLKEQGKEVTINELIETNGNVLKSYGIQNVSILLEDKNGEKLIKEQLLQKVLLNHGLTSIKDLQNNPIAKEHYEKGLKEIENSK